ncbi:TatD family hydrolase [Oscillospiraceae bacterium OttesenSCG-928-F05]|nr:TatD family hydrolase [Oscillospiraceae bacterium OttesenSCG-928-F05]
MGTLRFFDTHAHYDDKQFNSDRDALLPALHESGVALVVNPGIDARSSKRILKYAERYPFLYAAVGFHPHEAKMATDADYEAIAQMAGHDKCVAIGEIGLDYHYDFSPKEAQKRVFRAQLALAKTLDMPVIIHDREAHEDCLEIIMDYPGLRGVYHCFSGSLEHAKRILALGWMISFTGVITFKNARKFPEIIGAIPPDRIMIETDAPYMAPEPHRGHRNDSGYLVHVAEKIAEIYGCSAEEVAELTYQNGKRFFGID